MARTKARPKSSCVCAKCTDRAYEHFLGQALQPGRGILGDFFDALGFGTGGSRASKALLLWGWIPTNSCQNTRLRASKGACPPKSRLLFSTSHLTHAHDSTPQHAHFHYTAFHSPPFVIGPPTPICWVVLCCDSKIPSGSAVGGCIEAPPPRQLKPMTSPCD